MAYSHFFGPVLLLHKGGFCPIIFFYWDVRMKKEVEFLTFVEM